MNPLAEVGRARASRLAANLRFRRGAVPSIDGIGNIDLAGSNVLVPPIIVRGSLTLGAYTTFGGHNRSFGDVHIGRFCQIAPFVCFYGIDHPMEHLASYVGKALLDGRMKAHQPTQPVVVGNDVWIGHGAVVLKGVSIGDGAVVGAGSVITKSILPFEVVAGNPARVLRKRFPPEVEELVAATEWWNLDESDLWKYAWMFDLNLTSLDDAQLGELRRWAEGGSSSDPPVYPV